MQHLEVICAVRRMYTSLGAKGLSKLTFYELVIGAYTGLRARLWQRKNVNTVISLSQFNSVAV